jgi:hypothetical protein
MKTSLAVILGMCISGIRYGCFMVFILAVLTVIIYASAISFIYISVLAVGIALIGVAIKLSCMLVNKVIS